MTTTSAMPAARKRRRKTRTKNVSALLSIVASELKINDIDLTPGKEHLRCPGCERWTPITGMLSAPKLVPHPTKHYRSTESRRCLNSNRRVTLDVDVTAWRTKLVEAAPTTASRRATKVLPKPKATQPPAPVHRLAATREQQAAPAGTRLLPLLDRARRTVIAHRATCMTCGAGGRCGTGRELEIALREFEATAVLAREQQAFTDRTVAAQRRVAEREQARVHQRSLRQALPKVERATRARHNVSRTEARSTSLVDEHELIRRAASWPTPTHGGPGLPLKPLHI
ncbi:hypothetical protein [Streptomyces sp. NBC_00893]|uniref:hypothetical protein n=1 Tax=Streptomyces sp. NBC_00893 TaxID=2975862 RepID=UPI002253ED19|nr:hypothetical protein [Streptomyces sp. NBC_00893]MCX4851868.1 hypothetical protein [Streptomyces sp. NBC_00893]